MKSSVGEYLREYEYLNRKIKYNVEEHKKNNETSLNKSVINSSAFAF